MNLELQLAELEALRAMYPEDEGCFTLDGAVPDSAAAAAAPSASAAGSSCSLSGTITLPDLQLAGASVALRFQLPAGYPSAEPPLLSVVCAANRSLHEQLSCVVREAAEAAVGSESLLLVLGVLQEAVAEAAAAADSQPGSAAAADSCDGGGSSNSLTPTGPAAAQQQPPAVSAAAAAAADSSIECAHDVLQAVIWFHHIKNLCKRKHLVNWARELGCSGFSKPGFPGVVVVEGRTEQVREYIARVRALQWQAMQVRAEQTAPARGFAAGAQFCELPESGMSQLGQECRAAGLEDLFRAAMKLG